MWAVVVVVAAAVRNLFVCTAGRQAIVLPAYLPTCPAYPVKPLHILTHPRPAQPPPSARVDRLCRKRPARGSKILTLTQRKLIGASAPGKTSGALPNKWSRAAAALVA